MKKKPKEEKEDATDIVAERLAEILLEYYYWSKENKESNNKDSN